MTINDPTLNNMPAWTVTLPAAWKMQGMVMTSPCANLPSPVFRAYSADGLTQMRFEPSIGWRWRPNQRLPAPQGCFPLQQQVAVGGQTSTVSSAYSQTWTNGTQWYQTNDPNANPNGALPGNWNQATPTNGNGQP